MIHGKEPKGSRQFLDQTMILDNHYAETQAFEQKQTLYFFFKTVVCQHNDLAFAAIEQQ